jgi:hypothetical protein
MPRAVAPPFPTAPDDAVSVGPWMRRAGGATEEVVERIPEWDPEMRLVLSRSVEVNPNAVRAACALGEGSRLALVVSWRSSHTGGRGVGDPVELDRAGSTSAGLELDGRLLGGDLELVTALVLRSAGNDPGNLAATRPGSILWRDRAVVALEGEAGRFPVSLLPFSRSAGLDSDAGWALEWNVADLDMPARAAVRLLINSESPEIVATVRSDSPDPAREAVRAMIRHDIAGTLLRGTLTDSEFVAGRVGVEAGTLGRVIRDLIGVRWPGESVRSLAARLQERPERFLTEVQARFGLGGEG